MTGVPMDMPCARTKTPWRAEVAIRQGHRSLCIVPPSGRTGMTRSRGVGGHNGTPTSQRTSTARVLRNRCQLIAPPPSSTGLTHVFCCGSLLTAPCAGRALVTNTAGAIVPGAGWASSATAGAWKVSFSCCTGIAAQSTSQQADTQCKYHTLCSVSNRQE